MAGYSNRFLWTSIFILACCTLVRAADKTWTGVISDSMCGAHHGEMGSKMSDKQCTIACVKEGAKYVLVSDGKVYNISNQKFPDVMAHAGEKVRIMGEMTGDTIKVSKVTVAKP